MNTLAHAIFRARYHRRPARVRGCSHAVASAGGQRSEITRTVVSTSTGGARSAATIVEHPA